MSEQPPDPPVTVTDRRGHERSASVRTAAVSVQAVKIDAKQMTQAVFRQLPNRNVLDLETGEILGSPWGWVNYFADGCHPGATLHVLWADAGKLYLACVARTHKRASDHQKIPYLDDSHERELLNEWKHCAYAWLLWLTGTAKPLHGATLSAYRATNTYHDYLRLTHPDGWSTSVKIPEENVAYGEDQSLLWYRHWLDLHRRDDNNLRFYANVARRRFDEVWPWVEALGARYGTRMWADTYAEAGREYFAERAARAARQVHYEAQVGALVALDQLYIAV
jgi:hypothetical protein